jgi:hypothetical protein
MAYVSKRGRRPAEFASKSAHLHIVNSPSVQEFLANCNLPKRASDVSLDGHLLGNLDEDVANPIRHVITIDGGYREVPVQVEFPSATIAFFQFGALTFKLQDLEELDQQPFIDPDDMSKLKSIQRLELMLPIRNVTLKDEETLTGSVRYAIYDFFKNRMENGLDTLRWFIFEEYGQKRDSWELSSCPHCGERKVALKRAAMRADFSFSCTQCGEQIFLTDVFRLHEAIDDYLGAGGILGYVVTTIEQLILVHLIRIVMKTKPALLGEILFIKDGPLAFFGQTANMHKPMRALINHLIGKQNCYLVGLEKSGAFVEHADEIASKLGDGKYLILDNEYIYRYVIPGNPDASQAYGSSTYYGNKVIFKSEGGSVYVATLPTRAVMTAPTALDFPNLHVILANIEKLRCDMYDDALFPVALVNKLVSLADHPSARILTRFAVDTMGA